MTWIAVFFLAVLPVGVLAWKTALGRRLFASRSTRRVGFGLGIAALLLAMPWQGVSFDLLKHTKMLFALAVALLFALHRLRPLKTRRLHLVLGLIAALAGLNYVNYFAFHGERIFVHWHDVAHYYLGSKYYAELGYTDLYTAMLRAEAENHENRFKAVEARDLKTYKRVHVRELLRQSEPVKARFGDDRWLQFRLDVEYFRSRLDSQYGKVLLDHGFNPTPVWALGGGQVASQVPAGSADGIFLISLLDPLLLLLTFAVVFRTFGLRAGLLTMIFFFTVFGSSFGWVGGAFLRYPWFFGVVGGFCALKARRYGVAGTLFAVATMLRVFPAFFVAPLAAKGLWTLIRRVRARARRPEHLGYRPFGYWLPSRYLRFGVAFAVTCAALFASTALLPRGLSHWTEFRDNMELHVRNIAPNVVGVTEVAAHGWTRQGMVTEDEFEALKVRRYRIHQTLQGALFFPLCGAVLWAARRRSDLDAVLLGLPLLLVGLSLAAYYYAFLVLLVIRFRDDAGRLALIFGVEALSFALRLFEPSDGRLFVYRAIALFWLYVALWIAEQRGHGPGTDVDTGSLPGRAL